MVYLPRDAVTPLEDPPIIRPFPGLNELRRQTHWFIMNDPTYIDLVPVERITAPGGAWNSSDLPPRPSQAFKMIYQSGFVDGVVPTTDGQNRRYDFILVGEWDATVGVGDHFFDSSPDIQHWIITGLQPYNGYEIKAGVVSYGRNPQNG